MSAQPEASRLAAVSRLEAFVVNAGRRYSKSRNFDFGIGRHANVSLLSPYVRHRLLLEQEILHAVLKRHTLADAGKFVDEVFWRAYFKGWMEHRPAVWADYQTSVAKLLQSLEKDAELRPRYEAAVTGGTGIDCFDAWAAELMQTGYLHNHARMWFASIWVYTLGLPWQLGADFFYRHLLDADAASNTLSWRWVCGLHTRGKTYLARVSNIANYTDNRFNPQGQLATSAPPLSESKVFPVRELPVADELPRGESYGLLITEEDCSAHTLPLKGNPKTVLGAIATRQRSPLPVGVLAQDFASGAVVDGVSRAAQHFCVDGKVADTGDWGNLLVEWATDNHINTIVTGYAPVGPVADLLAATADRLDTYGVRLLQLRRPYDDATWPYASRGYFKLKAKIPEIISSLGLHSKGHIDREAG